MNKNFDGRCLQVSDYLSAEECKTLADWTQDNLPNFVSKNMTRFTSRDGDKVTYPALAYEIQQRIRDDFGIGDAPIIPPPYSKDGIIVSVYAEGGGLENHVDENFIPGVGVRMNVVVQASESGGELVVNDKVYPSATGELVGFLATEDHHLVTPVVGDTKRIVFRFGFQLEDVATWMRINA